MRKKVIINSHFNTAKGFETIEDYMLKNYYEKGESSSWIEERMNIFMNYTLKSLKNQTNQNFTTLIQYDDRTEDMIFDALNKYDKLPDNIQFVRKSDFRKELLKNCEGSDYAYLLRIDTDDMIHKSFIQQLYDFNHKENTEVIITQVGFLYDSLKNIMYMMSTQPHQCPPFYTVIYKTEDLKENINEYYIPITHNEFFYSPHELLPEDYNFIWHIHTNNVSKTDTRYTDHRLGKMITDSAVIKEILREFM